ncbi:xanthine dehydrogenase small subunit [Acidovorax sp. 1608163]|uniref:xanthine dehydrogenase small subunit n=1 Tax=Acidovorax sp. 1608163 TaxID=2478662 RepID=UPI000EF65337|nr:xanthine dehydrogenase small subunit [Acidovorax sp. 1608163]AYM96968.1 xanthine dehydrogenase small subunit [Acidovorax sp. 1608163]
MTTRPLQFLRRGQPVALGNVPPDRTLLEVLREDLGCTGTKEGCGEGDCGACTVVLGEADGHGKVRYSAVNSCIRLAHSIDGMALWTAEDLAEDPLIQPVATLHKPPRADGGLGARSAGTGMDMQVHEDSDEREGKGPASPSGAKTHPVRAVGLHPVQEAMVQCHGSQCGFCTPGFVMSLFGMYQNQVSQGRSISRAQAAQDLSGNLCRCTGYRPILDAAQQMAKLPPMAVNEADLLQKLELLALTPQAPEANLAYITPTTQAELLAARAAHPQAQVVAGATDVGLWVTKQHRQFPQVLDVTRAAELRRIDETPEHIAIGAAVTLTEAFARLTAQWPSLAEFAHRFAGLPVRNSGTLGGNVANGSPIGDSMPLLIALRAQVVLASQARGKRALLLESLYTGYRQNVMAPDELLVRIVVPKPSATEQLKAYKISKRFDDDISAVCLVLNLDIAGGTVQRASIGAGGVAATPVRAQQTEAALQGQPWTEATVQQAMRVLQAEFSPISDMRASGDYRRTVLGNLLQRFWLESQGGAPASIAQLHATHLEGVL